MAKAKKTNSTNSSTIPLSTDEWTGAALRYARAAVADKHGKTYCKWVRKAAKRFLDDFNRVGKKDFPFFYSMGHAAKACKFYSSLPHIEGTWKTPTITLEPWQIFIFCNVYGWRREGSNLRRFTTVYIEVPRKNGKSILASGTALYTLCCENEPGVQVKCAATTGKQARIVFNVAKLMVEKTPGLKKTFKLSVSANAIANHILHGNIEPINAKAQSQEGLNPHCSIIDELHVHKTRKLFDVLRAARRARRNPLSFYITTAGDDIHGVCYEQRTIVTKVLDGVYNADHYFGIIYTLDEGDDEFDEKNWPKANPNYAIMNQDEMREYALESRVSPETAYEFKTKCLNIWTTAHGTHINVDKWKACGPLYDPVKMKKPRTLEDAVAYWRSKGIDVTMERLTKEPCWGGLDLAKVLDMCAYRLVWDIDGHLLTWGKYYLPEAAVKKRNEQSGAPVQMWVDQGWITVTPGGSTDYAYIEKDILESLGVFNIQAIAFDPYGAEYLTQRLITNYEAPMFEFRQGPMSYNAPMNEIDRRYLVGKLHHEGNPVLTFNASNLVVRRDVNLNMAPDKKSSLEAIDGYVALAEATGIMIGNETVGMGRSVYEERGIVTIQG